MKSNPIMVINQKNPPLRKTHAAFQKLKFFPKNTQVCEYHATIIAAKSKINPKNNSNHLFMLEQGIFCLKIFCLYKISFT